MLHLARKFAATACTHGIDALVWALGVLDDTELPVDDEPAAVPGTVVDWSVSYDLVDLGPFAVVAARN